MKINTHKQHADVHIYRFGSHPFQTPTLCAQLFFVDGLLIDTGPNKMSSDILKRVKDLPVEQMFVTHHHEDHTGNLNSLQAHFKCPAYSSSLCADMMHKPPKLSFAQYLYWGSRPGNSSLLAKDDFIETPKYKFQIIPIPGHAKDMVALYEAKQGWLFSADLYSTAHIKYFLWSESLLGQIQTLKSVLKLDFDTLFCSHNPKVENGKERLRNKLDVFENLFGCVGALYQRGYSEKQIFKKLHLEEDWFMRLLSHGYLSKMNMVRAAIRDIEAREI